MEPTAPAAASGGGSIDRESAKRRIASEDPSTPHKQPRNAKDRFVAYSPEEKKLAEYRSTLKYEKATIRPSVRKSLYSNIHAAMGFEPNKKKTSGHKDTGISFDGLLVFMLRHVRLEDGSTFDIEAAEQANYIICQVS